MVKRGSSRRGFTLIEMLVAGAVAVIMLAAALALFVQSITLQQKQRKLAEMKRSAALVMGQLTTELRQAGLGRPRGMRVNNMSTDERFPSSIMVAEDQQIAFIADVPRPNSTFNGYSQLAASQIPGFAGLFLLNEANGSCDVAMGLVGTRCATDVSSLLFASATTSAGTDCASSGGAARTCPWALNRYQSREYIIVADGMGRWAEQQVTSSSSLWTALGNRMALSLGAAVPSAVFSDGAHQGFVSTPDRVFHWRNGEYWERKQCWGTVGGMPFSTLLTPCGVGPDEGTDWERLARIGPLGQPTFKYFQRDGTPLPAPVTGSALNLIGRVDIELQLERPMERPVGTAPTVFEPPRHTAYGSITLRQ